MASDESGYVSDYSPYTGKAPLTIRGVLPGQSEEDVVSLLGPPDRRHDSGYGVVSLQWQRFADMVVTLGAGGKVTEVLGSQLTAGGETVLHHGMSEADVRRVLGEPADSKGHYQPSGSGVISIGMKRTGRTLRYRRDGATIEVTVREESLAYIHLRVASP